MRIVLICLSHPLPHSEHFSDSDYVPITLITLTIPSSRFSPLLSSSHSRLTLLVNSHNIYYIIVTQHTPLNTLSDAHTYLSLNRTLSIKLYLSTTLFLLNLSLVYLLFVQSHYFSIFLSKGTFFRITIQNIYLRY